MKSYIALGPWTQGRDGGYCRKQVTGRPPLVMPLNTCIVASRRWRIIRADRLVASDGPCNSPGWHPFDECDHVAERFDFLLLSETPKELANLEDDHPSFCAKLQDGREVRLYLDFNNSDCVLLETLE